MRAGAGVEIGNGDDGRVGGRRRAADQGLEGGDYLRADDNRINSAVRLSGVAAFAEDFHAENIGGGHDRAGAHRDFAFGDRWPIMQAINLIAREFGEEAFIDHGMRAATAFLGGLEDEVNRAVKIGIVFEIFRGAEQHRGMAIMAAGVHLAGVFGFPGFVVFLNDVERVHVGAQADAFAGFIRGAFDGGDDAGFAEAGLELNAPFFKFFLNQAAGEGFLISGLRILVQFAAISGDFVFEGVDGVADVHQFTCFSIWARRSYRLVLKTRLAETGRQIQSPAAISRARASPSVLRPRWSTAARRPSARPRPRAFLSRCPAPLAPSARSSATRSRH